MVFFGTVSTQRKSNKKVPCEHEDDVQRTAVQSFQQSAGNSSPSVSGAAVIAVTTPVSPSKPTPNVLCAQYVMDSSAIDYQNRRRMRHQSSSRSSCTLKASVWTFATIHTFVIFMSFFCPPVAVAQSCPGSFNTAAPCTGPFHIATYPFPMIDMTEGCCACVAVKCFTVASLQAHQPSANNPLPLTPPDSVYGGMSLRNYCNR
jgi:hypothetical protein